MPRFHHPAAHTGSARMVSGAARIVRRCEIFLRWTRSILCWPRCMLWRGSSPAIRRMAAKASARNCWRRRFAKRLTPEPRWWFPDRTRPARRRPPWSCRLRWRRRASARPRARPATPRSSASGHGRVRRPHHRVCNRGDPVLDWQWSQIAGSNRGLCEYECEPRRSALVVAVDSRRI